MEYLIEKVDSKMFVVLNNQFNESNTYFIELVIILADIEFETPCIC